MITKPPSSASLVHESWAWLYHFYAHIYCCSYFIYYLSFLSQSKGCLLCSKDSWICSVPLAYSLCKTKWAEKIYLVRNLLPFREWGTLEAIFNNYSLLSSSQCSYFLCQSILSLHSSHFNLNLTRHIDLNRRVCFAFQPPNGQYHLPAFSSRLLNF